MNKKSNFKLRELCLEITNACPMDCLHCSGSCDLSTRNMLSLLEIRKIISDFAHLGGEILELSGGEPLMHPDIVEIITFAKSKGLEIILYTCGMALNANRELLITPDFAYKLQNSGLDKVIFSLQGSNSRIHDYITQRKGSFKNSIYGIRSLKSLDFWVGIHFVPMRPNFKELKDVIELCYNLGVNEIGLLRFVPQGRGFRNEELLNLSVKEFNDLTQTILHLRSSYGPLEIRIGRPINFCPIFDDSISKQPCNAGLTKCSITPNGNVVPCPAFKSPVSQNYSFVAGNLKYCSLVEIWRKSPVWNAFRGFNFKKMEEPCGSCEHLNWCQGGCKAQRLLLKETTNIFSGPDPLCLVNSGLKTVVKKYSKPEVDIKTK
jgi:radical SAM protein with 4Fe4S-binding SPASM domain